MRLRTGALIHLVPLARALVRHAPSSRLRTWDWTFGSWRIKTFTIKTQNFRISGWTRDLIQRYLCWFGIREPQLTHFILARMQQTLVASSLMPALISAISVCLLHATLHHAGALPLNPSRQRSQS